MYLGKRPTAVLRWRRRHRRFVGNLAVSGSLRNAEVLDFRSRARRSRSETARHARSDSLVIMCAPPSPAPGELYKLFDVTAALISIWNRKCSQRVSHAHAGIPLSLTGNAELWRIMQKLPTVDRGPPLIHLPLRMILFGGKPQESVE